MEDDEEFRNLYSDVLQPFQSAAQSQASTASQSIHRPIDLNVKHEDDEIETLAPADPISVHANSTEILDSAGGSRVLDAKDAELSKLDSSNRNSSGKDVNLMEKDVNFDIEGDHNGVLDDMVSDPIITGLLDSSPAANTGGPQGPTRDDDDWDSDNSEDDLQIVLNDNNHWPMAMERHEIEDDDEDGLVIVADGELNQPMEELEWAEDGAPAEEGERKEGGEAGKSARDGGVVPSKVGYRSHGYHPFHS